MSKIIDGTSEDFYSEFLANWNELILICCLSIIILCWSTWYLCSTYHKDDNGAVDGLKGDKAHSLNEEKKIEWFKPYTIYYDIDRNFELVERKLPLPIFTTWQDIDETKFEEICDDLANIDEDKAGHSMKYKFNRFLDVELWVNSVSQCFKKGRFYPQMGEDGEIDALAAILKRYGDKHNDAFAPHVRGLIVKTSYSSFKAAFNKAIQSDLNSNWRNIALSIRLTILDLESAGECIESVKNILRNTNRYLEEKYSNNKRSWIILGIFKKKIWEYSKKGFFPITNKE